MAYEQSNPDCNLIGRRQAFCTLAGIATAVAGISLVGVGTARAAEVSTSSEGHSETVTAEEAARAQGQDPIAAQRELAMVQALIPPDLELGGWTIEKTSSRLGAIAVVMRTPSGDAFQVDVLRRDAEIAGVADTQNFSLFIANSGDGSKATEEWQARGAKVLGHHIRRTERGGSPLPQLLTIVERERQHPSGSYDLLG